MEHYGVTIKKLRISRNMSQSELCQDIMSRSNLSRFENQEYIPAFDKVLLLLNQLEVAMDEFLYIHHNYQISVYEHMYRQLIDAENRKNHKNLCQIAAQIAGKKNVEKQYYELHLLAQQALVEHDLPAEMTSEAIAVYMRTVLLDTENWLFADFRRLNNFLKLFDLEEAVFLYNRATKAFQKYEAFPRENNIQIHLALNLGQLFAQANRDKQAAHYFELAKSYAEKKNKLFQKLAAEVSLERVIQPTQDKCVNTDLTAVLAALQQLGYHELVASLSQYRRI